MRNKFIAFTLAEVLVTMSIVGIIAALTLPTVKEIQPDKQKVLFKKAYTSVERVVTELVNDDTLYPEATGFMGLDNTTNVTLNNTQYGGQTKFCRLFAQKLNTINTDTADIKCPTTAPSNGATGTPSFTTNDSVDYYITNTTFGTLETVTVDTNGDKSPNCKYSTNCKSPDRFEIKVAADGGVSVSGDLEKSYLRSSSVIREVGTTKNKKSTQK